MLYQPIPKALDIGQINCISNEELASVQKFERLGSTVVSNCKMESEMHTRMPNASISFGRLKTKAWYSKDPTFKTKCSGLAGIKDCCSSQHICDVPYLSDPKCEVVGIYFKRKGTGSSQPFQHE